MLLELCIVKYNNSRFAIFIKYVIGGLIVASSQILSLYLIKSRIFPDLETNLAHLISVILSLGLGYQIHSKFSWKQHKQYSNKLIRRIATFIGVSFFSVFIRLVSFFILNKIGLNYLVNASVTILLAVIINFSGYDKLVFKVKNLKPRK